MSYLILSIDGGGIRGILAARLLERLEHEHPFLDRVEFFAGTSTGGIIALALAAGLSPSQLVTLYRNHGEDIFAYRDHKDRLLGPLDEFVRANYSSEGLSKAIEKTLGKDRTLGDLRPKRVLIPTFDLDNEGTDDSQRRWKPKFLHNFDDEGNDGATLVIDAALRTSVAPTYFPSHQGAIDGGVVANNPATCALAKAIKEKIPLHDIRLLSIGTGTNPHFIDGRHQDYGYKQWAFHILPLLIDGLGSIPDYQCKQFLGDNYVRCDPALLEVIKLDDTSRIDELIRVADCVDLTRALNLIVQ